VRTSIHRSFPRSAEQPTVANLHQRLQGLKNAPWAGYANRQKFSKTM
jgi:bifunctional non-homologous end joining protein LigD